MSVMCMCVHKYADNQHTRSYMHVSSLYIESSLCLNLISNLKFTSEYQLLFFI